MSCYRYSKQYLGASYKFGAQNSSTSSFDCTSFTQYVHGKNGINLPRSSKQQSRFQI
ncbi:NlpC/P60 family protein [Paenibacillus sp. V4I9]|uniref:NlpC/P60 family protein n=1 Tax=Paenibacillus sp. V4I9 TaxID=3042308 RepID=UPI0027D870FA|nr:NlpC/P60 family protein [Paenibacillus sp. V4I9]